MKYQKKRAEWKEKAIANAAKEMIFSVSKSYVEDPDKIAEVLQFASNFRHSENMIYQI